MREMTLDKEWSSDEPESYGEADVGGGGQAVELLEPRAAVVAAPSVPPAVTRLDFSAVAGQSVAGDSLHARAYHFATLHRGAAVKRAFDLLLTIVGGLLLSPLIAVVALLIRVSSPGPVFFAHERIGRFGRRFNAVKFRTMVTNGDEMLDAYFAEHPEAMIEWRRDHKLKNDPRVTAIGKFLRKTSLDELPQIWNVLLGEMSLVGPRPIVFEEIPKYGPDFDIYLQAVPGITGLWQVSGRNDISYRQRVSLDLEYIATWSVWLDLTILLKTVLVVFGQRGAY